MAQSLWQVETQESSVAPGIHLQSQAFRLSLPFSNMQIVWNRPLAVIQTTSDGQEFRQPVVDVTRLAQIGLALGALAMFVLFGLFTRRKTQEVTNE